MDRPSEPSWSLGSLRPPTRNGLRRPGINQTAGSSVALVPWTSFALRPRSVATILNEIALHDVQLIIECGIGISTLFALNSQSETSIRVLGIDDDAEWIRKISGYLTEMTVDSARYRLVHAPISEYQAS